MRILAILGSIVMLLLVCLGAAAWWVTEPMRFAGIQRNPAGPSHQAALIEVSHPGITRREIVELLRARDFGALTSIVETRTERALADPREEWELGRVMDAFEISDDSLPDEFDDWVQAAPNSFAPLLAAAEQRFTLAFLERGERSARDTTSEQFTGMTMQLSLLAEDVSAALAKEPRLSEAYVLLIDAARAGGTQIDCGTAAKAGLEIMPASMRIRSALAACRLPRWGGSYRRIEEIADAADAFVVDNPRLAALHGYVEWDRGRDEDGDKAIAHFDAALKAGKHWFFYRDRAAEHRNAKRFQQALNDVEAALDLAPDNPELLVDRLYCLLGLGRHEEIPDIVELVEAIDPMNTDLPGFKSYALKVATYEADRMQDSSNDAESIERANRGIALGGGDSMAYLVRGRGYLKAGDEQKALADFETAIRLDPTNFTAYLNIDFVYARRREWAPILAMWDAYLEKYPDDGRAVWERAGTIRHSGDETRAMQEAKRACDLGVKAACAAVRR